MTTVVRLGTRRSALAMSQSGAYARSLEKYAAEQGMALQVDLVEVTTAGDQLTGSLASLGGTGVFVSALREALLSGHVDLAVHSLKDLPTGPAEGLSLACVPLREDPRDVLVARDGLTLAELPAGSRVGTGSPRRAAQLRALGYGLEIVDIRGNVDTRLAMVSSGQLDAIVLAHAGLLRLGRADEATELIDPLLMLPAPGQGALGVECRTSDTVMRELLGGLDDPGTRCAVVAERSVLARLEAGCAAPLGVLAEVAQGEDNSPELFIRSVAASVDGSVVIRRSRTASLPPMPSTGGEDLVASAVAAAAGQTLAEDLLADGAEKLMPATAGVASGNASTLRQAREGDL